MSGYRWLVFPLACCLAAGGAVSTLFGRPGEEKDAPPARYETFRDPSIQRAFTAQVPAGWKVSGGARQPRLLTTVFAVEATSPDGQAVLSLRVNDAPAAHLDGPVPWPLPPDSTHVPITGVGMVPIVRYRAGAEFVTASELPALRREDLRFEAVRAWPGLARGAAPMPPFARADAGEVAYSYRRDGKPIRGGALAVTRMMAGQPGVPKLWHCLLLAVYEAAPEREKETRGHLVRLASTFRLDPDWVAGQEAVQRRSLDAVMSAGRHTAQVISDVYWRRQAAYDGIFQADADVRRGIVQLRDPRTGEEYTMDNKSLYYWIRRNGERVGTDDRDPPGPDAEPLIILDVRQK